MQTPFENQSADDINTALDSALNYDDTEIRVAAQQALAVNDPPLIELQLQAILAAMQDNDNDIRTAAQQVLAPSPEEKQPIAQRGFAVAAASRGLMPRPIEGAGNNVVHADATAVPAVKPQM